MRLQLSQLLPWLPTLPQLTGRGPRNSKEGQVQWTQPRIPWDLLEDALHSCKLAAQGAALARPMTPRMVRQRGTLPRV